tara:strand:+ start:112 stop:1209 length:1098 start_codon:yes stop_codon:yes gene_type:complete
MSAEKKQILDILSNIYIPSTNENLISNKVLESVIVDQKKISINLNVQNPTLQSRKKIEQSVINGVEKQFPNYEILVNVISKPKDVNNFNNIKNIIAIASGKGGVGKSTISSNLAVALSQEGYAVGLLDGDIYGPSIPLMFDAENSKPKITNIEGRSLMDPILSYGVKLLSIGFFSNPNDPIVWRGPMASKALNQMIHQSNWGDLDYLIIDLPPGTGDIHLSLVQSLPLTGAIIITTPQPVSIIDAKKAISMFQLKTINVPVIGIIENMSWFQPEDSQKKYYIFGRNGGEVLSENLKIPFLGKIPLKESIRESGDVGRPAFLQNNKEKIKYFSEITTNVIKKTNERNTLLAPTEKVKITHARGCSS